MLELHHVYVVLYAGVAVLVLAVAFVAWRRRAARGAGSVAILMLAIAIWSGGLAVMWYVPTLEQQTFWMRMTSLGTWLIPVAYLTLAFDVSGMDRWRTPGRIALISVALFVLNNVEWLNPGQLFDAGFVAHAVGPFTRYALVPGPLYWIFVLVAYGMMVIACVIILRLYLRSSGTERTQAAILFIGGLVPLVASVVTEVRAIPLDLDLAPLAFLVTGPLWLTTILIGTLLDVLPLARSVLVEQMLDGVVVVDGEDHVVDANPAALTMLRARLAQAHGKPAETIFSTVKGAAAVLHAGGRQREVLPFGSDGDSRYVELGTTPLVVGLGRLPAQLVTLHDVTEERRASQSLVLARQVFDTANEAIVVTLLGEVGRIIDVNDAYCRLTGRSREDTIGADVTRFQSDRHPREFYEAIDLALSTAMEWQGEVWQTRADGTEFPSWLSLSVAEDDHEHARHVVRVFTDITETKQVEEKLRHSATHDSLTGLPNRFLLDDRLEHALAHVRRVHGGLAVLFVDLDNFKDVNDTLGHGQGDALLVEVAERIVPVFRESDTVARLGGDEFTIIITDVKDLAQVEVAAQRMLEAITAPYRLDGEDLHVTASVGVALYPTDGVDAASLIKHADLAMYGAKEKGHNRIQFFAGEFQEGLNRRMLVEKELWGASEEERYFLLYQPQVDLSTGQITGAEALVRLRSRDGTVLSPAEFIPVAENSEVILQLGNWVLRRACADLAILHEAAPDLIMSVNFSARQFRGIDMTSLHDVLRAAGVEARFLALEITETALEVDPHEAAARLEDLRDVAGMRVSLDDFGTGFSSLRYVRMFHADTIKIDRSIIQLLPDDPEAQAIVLSTVALAKGLRATVIAEGPETKEQVRFLRTSGCDCAQGFYFSRPVPAGELTLLLRKGSFPLPDITAVDIPQASPTE